MITLMLGFLRKFGGVMEKAINRYAAVLLIALGAALGYEYIPWSRMGAPEWAAWVQAIGAIGAIGVAIYISWAQVRNDRAREKERDHAERLRILEGPMGILDAAHRYISKVPTTSIDEAKVGIFLDDPRWLSGFMRTQTALINIPLHAIPWWGISECVMEMLSHVDACRGAVNMLNHEFAQRNHTNPEGAWRRFLPSLQTCAEGASATMQKARAEAERIRSDRY
ncbi:hypothetical protein [Burkholderia cepacia]|uniref:hypothetical protein n=1 Tax=Burkholderia cepacia TaxID=292 RepID=UPI00398F784A